MRRIAEHLGVLAVCCTVLAGIFPATAARVRQHQDGSRITRLYGQQLAVGSSPEESAERFRVEFASQLGAEPGDLRLASRRSDGASTQPVMYQPETGDYKFTLVTFRQQREGIPVFRADLRVLMRNTADYPVVLAASGLRNLGEFVPGRTPDGFDPATQTSAGMETYSEPQMVIWAGIDDMKVEPVLAVTFVGESGSPLGEAYQKWLFVADAATGEILYQEDMIILTDVTGSVSGTATQGPKPDFCAEETPTPMAWALAAIQGGESTFADEEGAFTIPNPDGMDVTVESPVSGEYFVVSDFAFPMDILTQVVTPPGPAVFLHNADNTSEYVRARVNAYVEANVVRDFTLQYNPEYPVISSQTGFPVWVNHCDAYICPGNAWYDYESIRFCAAGAEHPNMAFSVIVHHEYGHHLVQSAGSGQGQYGEGMSDSIGMLITDDPIHGYGYYGDCNTGSRTAVNTMTYPCSGEIHYCGQLLSGCIWSTRNELAVTEPAAYLDVLSTLAVNSILLHAGTYINPAITIDWLILDDDDADFGNGTPHADEICAGFGAHDMDCPGFCEGPADCDDGLFCTGVEECVGGLCQPGPEACDDGLDCTVDSCDEAAESCTNAPSDDLCNDDNPCTDDSCDALTGCQFVPDDANSCDDQVFCNGPETCDDGVCRHGDDPCLNEDCYEFLDECTPAECVAPDGQTLSRFSGLNCTGKESYPRSYQSYANYCAPADNHGASCSRHIRVETVRSYLENGVCTNAWVDGLTGDHYVRVYREGIEPEVEHVSHFSGPRCTGKEFYFTGYLDGTEDCAPYEKDGAVCGEERRTETVLSWRPAKGRCEEIPAPGWTLSGHVGVYRGCGVDGTEECGNGDCNGSENCLTCPEDCSWCYCDAAEDCDDGLFCTGVEQCVDGVCHAGEQPCVDGVGCTADSCDEATQTCTNEPNHAVCDDANPCTDDICDPLGGCSNVNDDTNSCDDGIFCNGPESCAGGICLPGDDPCLNQDCDEADQCIPPVCVEPNGESSSHFSGLNCTGAESYYAGDETKRYPCRPADREDAVCGTGRRVETIRSTLLDGVCTNAPGDGSTGDEYVRVYREGIQPGLEYASHFSGPDCTGEEFYFTGYLGGTEDCAPFDSTGAVCGEERRRETILSLRTSDGTCENIPLPGWTLDNHVGVFRGCGVDGTEGCGNGECNAAETCETCPEDCGPCECGDGECNAAETCETCPEDCGPCPPCVEPDGEYISHFTDLDCTGTESYYLPYSSWGYRCRPDNSAGAVCGRIRHTDIKRSYMKDGVCTNAWPGGTLLTDFVRVYRDGCGE